MVAAPTGPGVFSETAMLTESVKSKQTECETLQNAGVEPSPIHLGQGVIELLSSLLQEHEFDRLFVVTDETVAELYGKALARHLEGFQSHVASFAPGEASKGLSTFERLVVELLDSGVTKRSIVLGFGGGVAGNMAGFLAGTLFRGIRLAHLPTSFQAQTDSTLSRKQALNCHGKNILGCFHTPLFTLIDTDLLETEPRRSLVSGVAESIKNALISDEAFFHHLEENLTAENLRDPEGLHDLAVRSILTKLAILKRDPTEMEEGLILEYGHTLAHALEALADGELTHGECVGIGMVFNARLSCRKGILPSEEEGDAACLLQRIGLPTAIPSSIASADLLRQMRFDNKRRGQDIEFVLLERTSRPHYAPSGYCQPVAEDLIVECLDSCRE